MFAFGQTPFPNTAELIQLSLVVITIPVVIHGLSASASEKTWAELFYKRWNIRRIKTALEERIIYLQR